MNKFLRFLAIGLASTSALFFYAEHKRVEGEDNLGIQAVEEVLSSQNRSLSKRIEEKFARADAEAGQTALRWKKKAKLRSFFSDTALAEPGAPKWVIVGGKRIRAAGTADNALVEDALEAHLAGSGRSAIYASKGKYYLFVKGTSDGQPYASAYVPEEFFSDLRSSEGIRDWLALSDGTVVFHPLHRFIGSNSANLRPVAAGLQELRDGKTTAFTQRYLGIEGRDALGVWSSLPEFGLLAATEWPKDPSRASRASVLYWLAMLAGVAACLLIGAAWRPGAPSRPARDSDFDFGRLDRDSADYVESVRLAAERALSFARAREEEANLAKQERNELSAELRAASSRMKLLEEFQERILPQATGKQVWTALNELFLFFAPGITLSFYRYSPSSFSLVPESVSTQVELPDSALAYLKDARIFIGNLSFLPTLEHTEAFLRWNRSRERHMPLHETEFRFFPVSLPEGGRGLVLALVDRRLNRNGELENTFSLFSSLVSRLGSFCERQSPLVQSSYAKGSRPNVASSPDEARNQPRPS